MDRRKFLNNLSVAAAASIAGASTLSAKADALEDEMARQLEKRRGKTRFVSHRRQAGTHSRR